MQQFIYFYDYGFLKKANVKRGFSDDCRSKNFDFDVLMMPCDHALLKFNSRQKSKKFKIHHQEDL